MSAVVAVMGLLLAIVLQVTQVQQTPLSLAYLRQLGRVVLQAHVY